MKLPMSRGDLSNALIKYLSGTTDTRESGIEHIIATDAADFHVSLWLLYQLHSTAFTDVDPRSEWDPQLIALRNTMESQFENELRSRFSEPELTSSFGNELFAYINAFEGPSLASFVKSKASVDQVRELITYRSIYHLRESDLQAWLIPRLPYAAKAALAELQFDEFGQGKVERLHARLFAQGMTDMGMNSELDGYIDQAPTEALELNNAMSFFGLHTRLLGAALGNLAAFEATSSGPSRKMAQGLRRLEQPESMIEYYEEHVEADAVHEQLAIRLICEPLVDADPSFGPEILFGAFTCMDLERRFAEWLLDRWAAASDEDQKVGSIHA